MGGRPQYALVSLALPADTEVSWVEELYRGFRAEGERYGTAIIGGNMATAPERAFIDVGVLGRVPRQHLLLRSGARPGDRVLVTGQLGGAAAGLAATLRPDLGMGAGEREILLEKYLTPTPRLPEAAAIAASGLASAMIDVSDGLSSDVGHICERSRVGVRLWVARLPLAAPTRRAAELLEKPAWRMALEESDDYELCFTAPAEHAGRLAATVREQTGTPVTEIGEILPEGAGRRLVLADGEEIRLEPRGWKHFG
jgi:thiamine-monophosphate kinase